jgi:radical SAM protein with 4Fe4S-binding SPASM domain
MSDHIHRRQNFFYDAIKEKKYGKLPGLVCIELNVTELCNRKCVFCPRHDPEIYPNRKLFMSDDVINKLIEQLQINNFKGTISFSGFGEPLLNPQILDFIIRMKKCLPDCTIEMTTNGDFLTKEKLSIIKDSIDVLIVDCYDGEEQVVERREMLDAVNFTKYTLRELWLKENNNIETQISEWNFNNRSGAVKNISFDIKQKPCYLPFYKISIDWNGNIILCCNDWLRQQGDLGNIIETPFYDLWMSDNYKTIRQHLKDGQRIDSACKNCSVNGTLVGRESVDIISQHLL